MRGSIRAFIVVAIAWTGSGAPAAGQPAPLIGDFNGDRIADTVSLVRGRQARAGLGAVAIVNPWSADPDRAPSLSAPVIVIVLGGAASSRTVLGDAEILTTPIWDQSPVGDLLRVVPRKDAPKAARGDAIAVATEAGIDLLLFWNGRRWLVETPNEEP